MRPKPGSLARRPAPSTCSLRPDRKPQRGSDREDTLLAAAPAPRLWVTWAPSPGAALSSPTLRGPGVTCENWSFFFNYYFYSLPTETLFFPLHLNLVQSIEDLTQTVYPGPLHGSHSALMVCAVCGLLRPPPRALHSTLMKGPLSRRCIRGKEGRCSWHRNEALGGRPSLQRWGPTRCSETAFLHGSSGWT